LLEALEERVVLSAITIDTTAGKITSVAFPAGTIYGVP
jgi:hypothetical protein